MILSTLEEAFFFSVSLSQAYVKRISVPGDDEVEMPDVTVNVLV